MFCGRILSALLRCRVKLALAEEGDGGGTLSRNSHRAVPSLSLPPSTTAPASLSQRPFPRYHLLKSITSFASSTLPPDQVRPSRLSVQTTPHSRTYPSLCFRFFMQDSLRVAIRAIIPSPHLKAFAWHAELSHSSLHLSPRSARSAIFTLPSPPPSSLLPSRFSFALCFSAAV